MRLPLHLQGACGSPICFPRTRCPTLPKAKGVRVTKHRSANDLAIDDALVEVDAVVFDAACTGGGGSGNCVLMTSAFNHSCILMLKCPRSQAVCSLAGPPLLSNPGGRLPGTGRVQSASRTKRSWSHTRLEESGKGENVAGDVDAEGAEVDELAADDTACLAHCMF